MVPHPDSELALEMVYGSDVWRKMISVAHPIFLDRFRRQFAQPKLWNKNKNQRQGKQPLLGNGQPSGHPSGQPTGRPTGQPSGEPSGQPTGQPIGQPLPGNGHCMPHNFWCILARNRLVPLA